ncbi:MULTISPECIES: phosphate/phosphite/phosphonate ABC transporter substrate-binding protein [Lysinibacillus]|nr:MULTISPECIES: phosphate/phosphite/phosphonate ABC transporter substrate-binding protein [Lysinibacillus]SCY64225.1 phosphonate transport system substrate-binding protein [Lysinibacillus sp. SG9]SDB25340.1 phosphonate transport system substrate-binding protein [Lysinibacillus sp. TC-37]SFS83369.1 phosphonate transport system substrate-binding protein [Lysinibacillus sp. SG55]
MKKLLLLTLMCMLSVFLMACGNEVTSTSSADKTVETSTEASGNESVDKLTIGFVPSRNPDEIITATEPLKWLLKDELAKLGFDVGEIDITVGTNFEAVGEALSAGTTDIGLIPGGTYVLYDDGAEVILTATRAGLNNDSDHPIDWNKNKPTAPTTTQATSYRAILVAGPSEKGKALAAKVNNGEKLTFEDLNDATWNVMSSSSPAGYIYPTLWLHENFDKTIPDLTKVVQADSYGSAFARLAAGQTDVLVTYADARRDYEESWQGEFARSASIWEETDLIGVMPAIYNDTISVSKNSKVMTAELKEAVQQAFINIGNTDKGKEVIAIYSHEGYQAAKDSDYDNERKAQKLVQNLGSN